MRVKIFGVGVILLATVVTIVSYSSKKDKRKNKPIKNQKNLGPIPNTKNIIAIPRKGLFPLL
ncbi:hypothetical protein ACQUEQ_12095 [Enterococcus casseliflavus]|uniref:hypothetical protein n=1 Tax=Enterococcus casseliflavus TaxID=37734 RepID=UPI003D0A4D16